MAGRHTDDDLPPSPRRIARMRARYLSAVAMVPCGCGCGLTFPATAGRQLHPQCPNRSRDGKGRLPRNRALLASGPKARRCELCEDLPHRRAEPRCPVCWREHAPEVIERDPSGPGCALGVE